MDPIGGCWGGQERDQKEEKEIRDRHFHRSGCCRSDLHEMEKLSQGESVLLSVTLTNYSPRKILTLSPAFGPRLSGGGALAFILSPRSRLNPTDRTRRSNTGILSHGYSSSGQRRLKLSEYIICRQYLKNCYDGSQIRPGIFLNPSQIRDIILWSLV